MLSSFKSREIIGGLGFGDWLLVGLVIG